MVQTSYISDTDYRTGQASQFKSIQSWKKPKNLPFSHEIEQQIETVQTKPQRRELISFENKVAQAHNAQAQKPAARNTVTQQPFKFGDVVDIINPLHHIPLVGGVYRELSNNQLHPLSQIIGGSLYGGPIGAVTGTANAIAQVQTGKDLPAHAFDFLT